MFFQVACCALREEDSKHRFPTRSKRPLPTYIREDAAVHYPELKKHKLENPSRPAELSWLSDRQGAAATLCDQREHPNRPVHTSLLWQRAQHALPWGNELPALDPLAHATPASGGCGYAYLMKSGLTCHTCIHAELW